MQTLGSIPRHGILYRLVTYIELTEVGDNESEYT